MLYASKGGLGLDQVLVDVQDALLVGVLLVEEDGLEVVLGQPLFYLDDDLETHLHLPVPLFQLLLLYLQLLLLVLHDLLPLPALLFETPPLLFGLLESLGVEPLLV